MAESRQKRKVHPNSLANLKPRHEWPRKGRVKGELNLDTRTAKTAIAEFVDKHARRLDELIQRIEKEKGAEAAWKCFTDLVEFRLPKLARTEHVGSDGGPIQVVSVAFMGLQTPGPGPAQSQLDVEVVETDASVPQAPSNVNDNSTDEAV